MIVVAMALAASVVLVLSRAGIGANSAARLRAPMISRSGAKPSTRARRQQTALLAVAAAVLTALVGAGLVASALLGAAALALRLAHHHRIHQRAHEHAVRAVPAACRVLAMHLRAGSLPVDALVAAAASSPPPLASALRSAATAERLGSPASAALRASDFGAGALWPVAVCWQICSETGAALGSMLERLAFALSAEQEDRDLVDVELAGVRLSAAVMAGLPIVGLLLGTALGTDPFGFLLDSGPGRSCLAAAVFLDLAGVYWVRRLGARAAR